MHPLPMVTAPKNQSIYQGDYTTILGRTEMVVQFLFSIAIIPVPVLIDSPSDLVVILLSARAQRNAALAL